MNGMKSNILGGEVQCKGCNVCIVLLPFFEGQKECTAHTQENRHENYTKILKINWNKGITGFSFCICFPAFSPKFLCFIGIVFLIGGKTNDILLKIFFLLYVYGVVWVKAHV